MSSSRPPQLLLSIIILSFQFTTINSSQYSTFAISHLNPNTTLVCALILTSISTYKPYNLNCTSAQTRRQRSYTAGSTTYSAIAAGDGFLCALSQSTNVSIMRWWEFRNTSTNSSKSSLDSKRVYKGPPILALSAGDTHVCGIQSGVVRHPNCWRWNQLELPENSNFSDIAVGRDFVCGLLSDQSQIKCFGNDTGVVGNEPTGAFALLAAGTFHACGVSDNGDLHCWGLGAPAYDSNPFDISSLSLGENRTCALSGNRTVKCWGQNSQLPKSLVNSEFASIEAKGNTICGVLWVNYSLVCWGSKIFDRNHLVYNQVLPGTCMKASSCPCGAILSDSGRLCPDGEVICNYCPSKEKQISPFDIISKKKKIIFIVLGSIGIAIGIITVSFIIIHFGLWKRGVSNTRSGSGRNTALVAPLPAGTPNPQHGRDLEMYTTFVLEFPFSLIMRVTGNFSESQKIGSGSFGSVYRCVLDDGRIVAIKRAETSTTTSTSSTNTAKRHRHNEAAFVSELALLSRVNHKNLVSLIGYCREGAERVLVYEFMANGTLHDHLHKLQSVPLRSWGARLRVALDAARGIEYLHVYAVPPIIHRDIKSSNILLDDNWIAKVSDFGLSLLSRDEGQLERSSSRSSSMHVTAGTVGYMDPEGYRLQNLTIKSDVYSFGVVLLELLTGHKAVHRFEDSGTPKNIVEYVMPHILVDNVDRILDPNLPPPTPCEIEAVTYLCYLAGDCVNAEGRHRPTMTEVVSAIERAMATYGVTPAASLLRSNTTRTI